MGQKYILQTLAAQAKGILYCPRRLHTCLAVPSDFLGRLQEIKR